MLFKDVLRNSLGIFSVLVCHPISTSSLQPDVYRILLGTQGANKAEQLSAVAGAAPAPPTGICFSPFGKLWARLAWLFSLGLFIVFSPPDQVCKTGLPHYRVNKTKFGVHHDSKWFSNEIIKQQHCLSTMAKIWSSHLLSRLYGKCHSHQWRTTQNKYPRTAEAGENKRVEITF